MKAAVRVLAVDIIGTLGGLAIALDLLVARRRKAKIKIILLENLVVVQAVIDSDGETPVMEFETITMAPFDRRLLSADMLSKAELDWLNSYHRRVWQVLETQLDGPDRDWLLQATALI
mgnify:CR=1 FL=1